MDPKEIQRLIERRYLQCIVDFAKTTPIPRNIVRVSAQVMQAMRPWASWDEALLKTEFFVSKFPMYLALFEYVKNQKNEAANTSTIDMMHKHLRENNIDMALQIANNAI